MNNEKKREINIACAKYEFPDAISYNDYPAGGLIEIKFTDHTAARNYVDNANDMNRIIEKASIDITIVYPDHTAYNPTWYADSNLNGYHIGGDKDRDIAILKCVCSLIGADYD